MGPDQDNSSHKWGFLGKITFLPRAFSDTYSFASAHFECNVGQASSSRNGHRVTSSISTFADEYALSGLIGWLNDSTIVVVSSGEDGKWERFAIVVDQDGKRHCMRNGWKRYLGR